MAEISITPLSTSNTAPTITGYVDFERLDAEGKGKQTISVYVNYTRYKLFDGNLGLDESVKPNKWKLHFSSSLPQGTYQVEAYVSDVATDTIVASSVKDNGLIINPPTAVQVQQQKPSILEKVATVALLMASLDKLFGGKNGIAPVPSVHPAVNDEASTALVGRGKEESAEDTMVKSRKATQRMGVSSGNNVKNKAVDPAAANAIPAASLDKVAGAMLENGTSAGVEMDLETVKTEMSSTTSPTDVIETLNEAAATRAGLRGITSNEQFNVPQYDALGNKIN
jgi:hypothetical protein